MCVFMEVLVKNMMIYRSKGVAADCQHMLCVVILSFRAVKNRNFTDDIGLLHVCFHRSVICWICWEALRRSCSPAQL